MREEPGVAKRHSRYPDDAFPGPNTFAVSLLLSLACGASKAHCPLLSATLNEAIQDRTLLLHLVWLFRALCGGRHRHHHCARVLLHNDDGRRCHLSPRQTALGHWAA